MWAMMYIGLLLTVTFVTVNCQSGVDSETLNCVTPDGLEGSCIPYLNCSAYSSYIEEGRNDTAKAEFLRQRICKTDGPKIYLCCVEDSSSSSQGQPPTKISRPIPTEEECGIPSQVSGDQPGAWPWVALLGFLENGRTKFHCHGALITTRHILSVAHCMLPNLHLVRLGEYHIEHNQRGEHPIDFGILQTIRHPNYLDPLRGNDIGIVTLDSDVAYTERIRPVCLPFLYENDDLNGRYLILVGYGRTDPALRTRSNIPVTAETIVVSQEKCRKAYSRTPVENPVLCTGDGNVHSCNGDSGISLTIYNPVKNRFYAVGLVSYGTAVCGNPNFPDVNTLISRYLGWIREEVS